jgi:hypothetical protein
MISSFSLIAQNIGFNSPVSGSANLSCRVIKALSVCPNSSDDYINWPTIPVGSKYILNSSDNQDADWKSIFTFSGEPGSLVEISISAETFKDNVEISYRLKGTPIDHLGVNLVPLLNFVNGKTIVTLNAGGAYYLHIVYDWVFAHQGSTPGEKNFTQIINAQYTGL